MKTATKEFLIDYVSHLILEEGFKAIHVSDLIPRNNPTDKGWTQFVELDENDLPENVTYHKPTGWFRLVEGG